MRKQRNLKKIWITAAFLTVIALAGAVMVRYLIFVEHSLNQGAAAQLSEVYGQINYQFNDLADKNWNLLYDANLVIQTSENEELLEQYVEQMKEQWGFNTLLFLDENSSYVDTDGHSGYLNLGRDFSRMAQNKENIVVDGSLSGADPVVIFAIPVERGTYRGFSYTAVALGYDNVAIADTLMVNAFGGSTECYIIYPDGRVFLSMKEGHKSNYNLFTMLKAADFQDTDFSTVRADIQNGGKNTWRYTLNGEKKYLYYQPVGFQNWVLVGTVPQKTAGQFVSDILRQTALLVGIVFVLILFLLISALFYWSRTTINRKNAELEYRERLFDLLAKDTTNVFMIFAPGEHRAIYVSPNVQPVLGVSAEAILQDINVLGAPQYVDGNFFGWEGMEQIPLGETVTLATIRRHGGTGVKHYFQEIVYHISVNETERFILVLSDRTEDRRNQESLRTALDIARTANQSKSMFLSNMSHDIRTPMNAIIGLLPLLQRDAEKPERVREYVKKLTISSHHLLGLINDVLDMSKIESGKTALNMGELDLEELVESLTSIIRPQTDAKGQVFEVYVRDITYEHLIGDKLRLTQIMVNILSNAVKYTPEGGRVELWVSQLPQVTKDIVPVRFVVMDTGIGMTEEYQKVIFEPFTRANDNVGSMARGTGLGMAIAKNLVDLMGGTISLKSAPNMGSTFTVELGLRIRPTEVDPDFWKKHHLLRSLVVDDEQDICDNVVRASRENGLAMEYALSGREALAKITAAHETQQEFNLVLLDWKMPDMDGLETARHIREKIPSNIPILILTAYDWSEIESEARAIGINGFLAKPFFVSNLRSTVEKLSSIPEFDETPDNSGSFLQNRHFLAAEDYELNAEILVDTLETYGADCDVCENGEEVLKCFAASAPGTYDLILMDIQMPVMNGCEAAKAIRNCGHPQAGSIPIVAMSANAFAEDVQEAMNAGMNAYLTKPVDAKLLEKTLVRILSEREEEGT